MPVHRTKKLWTAPLLVGLLGCMGESSGGGNSWQDEAKTGQGRETPELMRDMGAGSGGDGGAAVGPDRTTPPLPPPTTALSPLRRLSPEEIEASVEDLFKTPLDKDNRLGGKLRVVYQDGVYENDLNHLSVTPPTMSALSQTMEHVGRYMMEKESRRDAFLPCELSVGEPATLDQACAGTFLTEFLPKAWRRQVDAEEVKDLKEFWEGVAAQDGISLTQSTVLVLERILLSPHFLYRVEQGGAPSADPERLGLTGHEQASRLSYLIWGSMPDEELFGAAERGELETADQIEAQARRMLRQEDGTPHPRAQAVVRRLVSQWIGLGQFGRVIFNREKFDWGNIQKAMIKETELFFDEVLWNRPLSELLTADYSFMNEQLADHYGIDGPTGESHVRVSLPQGERQGLLTQGSVLARVGTSPIHRGAYVVERLMCKALGEPPENAEDLVEPGPTEGPIRARLLYLEQAGPCSVCHIEMHGIGYGFLGYDDTGRWRSTIKGEPVDLSGQVEALMGASYDGVPELSTLLEQSRLVEKCLVQNLFQFAYGRAAEREDRGEVEELKQVGETQTRFEDVLIALVRSPTFRTRAKPIPQQP